MCESVSADMLPYCSAHDEWLSLADYETLHVPTGPFTTPALSEGPIHNI